MKILIIVLIGFLLFFLFSAFRIVLKKMADNYKWGYNAKTTFGYIAFVIWILYYFWAIDRIFYGKSYYDELLLSSVIILLILFTWFYFKNVLAGFIFKVQHQPRIGKMYSFDKYSGTIKNLGIAHLDLETADGEELKIPYSSLFGPIYERSQQKMSDGGKIRIEVKKTENKEVLLQKMKAVIFCSPWATFKKDPLIKTLAETDGYYEFEISIGTLNARHLLKIEKALLEEMG